MIQRRVQCLEVVPLRISLGAARTGEAKVAEDVEDLGYGLSDRVQSATPSRKPWEREIRAQFASWPGEFAFPGLQSL